MGNFFKILITSQKITEVFILYEKYLMVYTKRFKLAMYVFVKKSLNHLMTLKRVFS